MRNRKLVLSFPIVLGILVITLGSSCAKQTQAIMNKHELTPDDFRNQIEVTFTGPSLKSYPSQEECVYFEWAYGNKVATDGESAWAEYSVGFQSDSKITLQSSIGQMQLSRNEMRLFLSPEISRIYNHKEQSRAPEATLAWIAENGSVAVEEYMLFSDRTYFAVLHVDTYNLPPDGAGPPRRGQKKLLWISDRPFLNGKPVAPMTPAYRGWTY
ncbi:MAG: hypothetical protein K8S54_16090 [Spirochaetia bacterium]|nr:hypothetical protein [Spirochaetia bacterium]